MREADLISLVWISSFVQWSVTSFTKLHVNTALFFLGWTQCLPYSHVFFFALNTIISAFLTISFPMEKAYPKEGTQSYAFVQTWDLTHFLALSA